MRLGKQRGLRFKHSGKRIAYTAFRNYRKHFTILLLFELYSENLLFILSE